MSKRKGLSKSLRFEVFKRDRFHCMYCGQSPPAVVLQVDHILPVAQGGRDELANLLTSCQDCNLGKGDRSLDQVPASLADTMERRQEAADQVEAYNRFLLEERDRELAAVGRLGTYWCDKTAPPRQRGKYTVCAEWAQSLRRFLRSLPEAEILDAMDRAHARVPSHGGSTARAWRYFCGICWNKIRGENQG